MPSPSTQPTQCAAFGDIDGDHVPDLVMCAPFAIALGHANGTFTHPTQSLGFRAPALALADADGDGTLDAVFATGEGVGAFANAGGTFLAPSHVGITQDPMIYTGVADFDRDGEPDLASSFGAVLDPASGVLALGPLPPVAAEYAAGLVGDFNHDGNADILFSQQTDHDGHPAPGVCLTP